MAAKVISFFSTKGGVGKTLLSLNLAVNFSLKKKKTLFLDLDLGMPQPSGELLGVKPKYYLHILSGHFADFKSKKRSIYNYLTPHQSGLSFLPAISKISQRKIITPEVIDNFISLVGDEFDFIVIDAGTNLSDCQIAVFDISSLLMLVLTPDILAFYQTQWLLDTLQAIGYPLEMIKILLNRAESKGSIDWQELKVVLASEVIAAVPSEGKNVGFSVNQRIPLMISDPRSKVATAISSLGDILMKRDKLYITRKKLSQIRLKKEEDFEEQKITFLEKIGLGEKSPHKTYLKEEEDEIINFKKRVHKRLLNDLDLKRLPIETYTYSSDQMETLRRKAEGVVANAIASEAGGFISSHDVRRKITREILDEALALGPLEDLLNDDTISEIMVNNKDEVYIERMGKIYLTSKKFTGDEQVRITIERILAPLGRRIDESTPYVDARLPDGSRVNAIISPLSLTGPTLTIRKFFKQRYKMNDLIKKFDTLTPEMACFLNAAVKSRKNILVSGGTGSGKTTFLNILSEYIPEEERIVTIEDAAELKLSQNHWIRLESRAPNIEGKGAIPIKILFRNSLRMRPDRILVGEVRGDEVIDMLQAMNTGHDGSMSTIHANTTHDVIIRIDSMILMSEMDLPIRAIREMISSAIDVIVQTARFSDGSRKVTAITEVAGMADDTHVELRDIFRFQQTGVDEQGKVKGFHTSLGYIPSFYDEIRSRGIDLPREIFISKG